MLEGPSWGVTCRRWSLLVILAAACGGGKGTVDLVVDLRTDLVPAAEFAEVVTSLAAPAMEARERPGLGVDLLAGARVATFRELPRGVRELHVRLLGPAGALVAERRVVLDQRSTAGVTVTVTRDCVGVACPLPDADPALTTCFGGRCVDPLCVDAAMPECGPPECAGAGDCPMLAACSRARCDQGVCLYARDDAACAAGEYCSADLDCVRLPELVADAGAMDSGPTGDSCEDGRLGDGELGVDCGGPCPACPFLDHQLDGRPSGFARAVASAPDDGFVAVGVADVEGATRGFAARVDGQARWRYAEVLTIGASAAVVAAARQSVGHAMLILSSEGTVVARIGDDGVVTRAVSLGGLTAAESLAALPGDHVGLAVVEAGDIGVLRLDDELSPLWFRTLGLSGGDETPSVVAADGDDVVVAGLSSGPGRPVALVARIDADGGLDWARSVTEGAMPSVRGATVAGRRVVVAGEAEGRPFAFQLAAEDGAELGRAVLDVPDAAGFDGLAALPSGSVWATGVSGAPDLWRLDAELGVELRVTGALGVVIEDLAVTDRAGPVLVGFGGVVPRVIRLLPDGSAGDEACGVYAEGGPAANIATGDSLEVTATLEFRVETEVPPVSSVPVTQVAYGDVRVLCE